MYELRVTAVIVALMWAQTNLDIPWPITLFETIFYLWLEAFVWSDR